MYRERTRGRFLPASVDFFFCSALNFSIRRFEGSFRIAGRTPTGRGSSGRRFSQPVSIGCFLYCFVEHLCVLRRGVQGEVPKLAHKGYSKQSFQMVLEFCVFGAKI